MRTSAAKSILFTAVIGIIFTSSTVAQTGNSGFEQRYRAKYGRPFPVEQSRVMRSTEPTSLPATYTSDRWFEQWHRAKFGRPSPMEEARLNMTQAATEQPSVAVLSSARFEGQASEARPVPAPAAEPLSKEQLHSLIAAAKTPAEHLRIAEFYRSKSRYYLAQSKEHSAMIAAYKSNPGLLNSKNEASTINHCEHFVQRFNELAVKSNQFAELHEHMAADAAKM